LNGASIGTETITLTDPNASTPTQPTLVNTISITGGAWNTATYDNVNTDVNNTYYEYGLSIAGEQVKENYYIAYNWTTRKWFDTQPTNHHNTFGTSSSDLNTTSRETTENPAVLYVFDTSPRFTAQFTNPYYEPVEPQTLTNVDSSAMWNHLIYKHRTSTTAEEIYDLWSPTNNDFEASTDDSILSIAVEKSTNTWKDYGTNVPDSVVENTDGTVSVLDASNVLRYKFTKPTTASWL
jgi:hypothetical protein